MSDINAVRTVKTKLIKMLQDDGDFCGIGVGFVGGDYCIVVNFKSKIPDYLPKNLDGVKIKADITGEAEAY